MLSASSERTFALVVGVERYAAGDRWNLRGPAHDACRFARWLVDGRKVPPANVFLCLSNCDSLTPLPIPAGCSVEEATRDAVHTVVKKRIPRRGDLFFLFWGGHGVIDHDRERRLFYQDATDSYKQNLDLRDFLRALRTNRFFDMKLQVCVIDACANRFDDRRSLAGLPHETFGDAPDTVLRNQFVFFGASAGEVAANDPQAGSGQFSSVVLEELERAPGMAWPPPLEKVAARTLERFGELRVQGKAGQTPAYAWFSDWASTVQASGDLAVPGERRPQLGPVVSHLCDRSFHDFQCGTLLRARLDGVEPRALAFLLYGESGQGHDSFVERVLRTQIGARIEELWGKEHPSPPQRKVPWESLSEDLDEAKGQVAEALIHRVGAGSALRTGTHRDLNLRAFRPSRVVVLRHRVEVERWTATTESLLRWYMETYWPTRFDDPDDPSVLLFIQLVCNPTQRLSWRTLWSGRVGVVDRMRRDLQRLAREVRGGAARVLIDELTPVTPGHVMTWCTTHDLYPFPYEARCDELARRVFRNKDGSVAQELPMAEVERRLDAILKQLARRQSA